LFQGSITLNVGNDFDYIDPIANEYILNEMKFPSLKGNTTFHFQKLDQFLQMQANSLNEFEKSGISYQLARNPMPTLAVFALINLIGMCRGLFDCLLLCENEWHQICPAVGTYTAKET
jgi:hypothetical protein